MTKKIILSFAVVVLLVAILMVLRDHEDDWICQNDQWVQHGNPSASIPESGCGEKTVMIFLGNSNKDPQGFNCEKVYPVLRILPKTEKVELETIKKLLEGPTVEEISQGYFTTINAGVGINDFFVENGIVKIDFNEKMEEGVGGSCRVTAIRAQITDTLKQFPEINEVIIFVNGRSEDVLQP